MHPTAIPDLVSFWDFHEPAGAQRVATGPERVALHERQGSLERITGGPFGSAVRFTDGGRAHLFAPRNRIGALDIHGTGLAGSVTVVAWVRREKKARGECQSVAGVWGETFGGRQYCLFLDLGIHRSSNQVCGHISGVGGPSFGFRYCMDAGIGATPVSLGDWHCVAMTYDGANIRAYLDGHFDERPRFNPYPYTLGVHTGQPEPAEFTVGAVHRHGEYGNHFVGDLGGLAVYRRALSPAEIAGLAQP